MPWYVNQSAAENENFLAGDFAKCSAVAKFWRVYNILALFSDLPNHLNLHGNQYDHVITGDGPTFRIVVNVHVNAYKAAEL